MKFFNSDKSGFLSFVAKRMKALFALFFIIAGVQTLSAALVKGSWDGWQNHDLIQVAGNEYYVDIEMTNAATDEFGIDFNEIFYSLSNYTITNWCSRRKFYTNNSNCKFTHNAGTYRFRVWDDGNEKTLTITGIIVTIYQPVQNADGSYTITGHFTNSNPDKQKVNLCAVVFGSGETIKGKNSEGVELDADGKINQEGETFTVTTGVLSPEVEYSFQCKVVDNAVGEHFSESITFTPGQDPTPSFTDLYLRGEQMGWGAQSSDEWKQTSVSSDGNVYTWDWTSAPKTLTGNFKIAALPADGGWDNSNNFGPKDNDVTLSFEKGVATVTVWSDGGSKNINTTEQVSKIEFDKADLTVTFYTPEETPDPVYAATITADASASQQTAKQVKLTSSLTETSASTDLSAATCQFQYLSADAAEGTEYSNLDDPVAYSTEGASLTTTALPQGGKYLFRAVWTLNGEVVATSELSEATCVYPIWPEPEMFDVVWIPTYNTSDGSVTITAEISAKEDACFVMGQIVGLVANIFVDNDSPATSMSNPSGAENNKATATATIQNVNEGQELAYRLELTTGASQQVLGRGGIQITGGTYVVKAPEEHKSTVYLRGDINGWAYDGIDDKYVGKTYDGVNVFWDWSGSPVEFVTTGESGGSKFKFDDTTDGEWGTGQWSGGDQDVWIGEEQISNNKATLTTVNDDKNGAFYLVPEICPATIRRIDLNVKTNQLVITFDSYKQEFKDLWFRSPMVVPGWGDAITDPIAEEIDPKYQGQTSNGVVYTWDWSGSNAVTIDAGTLFKFGEYKGSSWGDTAYGGLNVEDRDFTSEDFGNPLQTIAAAGYEFSPDEKLTITGVTLDTENMTVVFEGEAYVERFPVTVNTVNGEAGGTVTTEPVDIGNMAIGETVTVTATANEGYVALFEAISGCDMTDGSADNIKEFEITAANPVITVTFQVQCQTVEPGFTISGRFNAGILDADGLYQGKPISSGEPDPANGYWSDGARFIQLTANSVPANDFEWECTTYAIDGVNETIPDIAWTGQDKTSACAELSQPGTYTFVCKARCNETDKWTYSEELTITAPAPEMGFDGPGFVGSAWDHASAGIDGQGLMTRQPGTMIWKSRVLNVANFGEEFVVIQRYKTLGCNDFSEKSSDESSRGWTGNGECGDMGLTRSDNKVNRAETLKFMNVEQPGDDANFKIANGGNWTAGEGGTQLQLVVTMTGYDSYMVALEEVSQECTTPADNFPISAQLNKGAGAPFEGNLVASGSSTKTGGYFADGFRTVTLTTTQVADTYEWKLVGYAIDGNPQATADLTTLATITNGEAQTATALLSRPGDYTFQCTAACTDGTPVNSATVTISTYPEMGFDGPIGTPANLTTEKNGWNHAWAGTGGLMNRAKGSLTWSKTFIYQNQEGLSDQNCFVVIQRYKLGCIAEASQGWAGFDECGGIDGNKINKQDVEMSGVHLVDPGTLNYNFVADDVSAWTPGVTELTLTVTMTGWDSYTVELAKKQEQIEANYSSNDETKGTVAMKVGDTPIANGEDITAYIGQQVTLTATPAQGYKVASWEINGKVTKSDRTTISPTLSGEGLNVVVTFERDCYSGVVYDLNGGGIICANGGSTELSLNTLNNVTYQLYKDGAAYGEAVKGNGEAAKWTISEAGTYTAKAYDSRFGDCQSQAIDMNGSADVTTVTIPKITVNPGDNVHLTVLQARSFTAQVPVDWSITDVTGSGKYCEGDRYMISSQTDTSLVAKFLCIGTAKITATMKAPNQNCTAEVTVHQNDAATEDCAPEPEDMQ